MSTPRHLAVGLLVASVAAGGCGGGADVGVGRADTTPPTATITSPANGATVSATVSVVASVADDVGLAEVSLEIDGAQTGHAFAQAPAGVHTARLDTTTLANAAHAIRVCALDTSANASCSAVVTVTVFNPVTCQAPFVPNAGSSACVCPGGTHEDGGTCVPDVVPDDTAPFVQILSPAAGEAITGDFVVTASAQDDRGVATVAMTMDGVATYEMTLNPVLQYSTYVIHSTELANGLHFFQVCAVDTSGNVGCARTPVSARVNNPITCPPTFVPNGDNTACVCLDGQHEEGGVCVPNPDVTAPTVLITAPTSGTTVSGSFALTVTAVDDRGIAQIGLVVDGAQTGNTFTENPANVFTTEVDSAQLTNGSHTLRACASDTSANASCSSEIVVVVTNVVPDTTPPNVFITAPANGATVSGTFSLTVSVVDNRGVASVALVLDGVQTASSFVNSEPYVYTSGIDSTQLSNAPHTLKVCATDTSANISCSNVVTVTVENVAPDITPPTVNITAPANGSIVSGTLVLTASVVDDRGVAEVGLLVDGIPVDNVFTEEQANTFTTTVDTASLGVGSHGFRVCASDPSANSSCSSPVTVTVRDSTPPTASIIAPAGGAVVSGVITVTANVTDDRGIFYATLYVDDSQIGIALHEVSPSTYSNSVDTAALTEGLHTLRVRAADTSGNTSESAAVTVTVQNVVPDNTPPTVVITAPAYGATVSGTFALTASIVDDHGVADVLLAVDGTPTGSTFTEAPAGVFTVAVNTIEMRNGQHSLRVCASDSSANVGCANEVDVTVANISVWRPVPTGPATGAPLRRIWGSSSDSVWFTAYDSNVVYHWNGTAIEAIQYSPFERAQGPIWGSGPNDIWVATRNLDAIDVMVRWDGVQWSNSVIPATSYHQVSALWGFGANDLWAAMGGDYMFHYVGGPTYRDWEVSTNVPPGMALLSLWGSTGMDVWAAGSGIVRKVAPSVVWSPVDTGIPRQVTAFNAIWGSGPNDVWFVGYGEADTDPSSFIRDGVIVHWDGASWSEVPHPKQLVSEQLIGVWGSGSDDVWLVGGGTDVDPYNWLVDYFILHWDGASWSRVVLEAGQRAEAVWGSGPNDVWVAGDNGTILHYSP